MVGKIHKSLNVADTVRYLRKEGDDSKSRLLDDSFGNEMPARQKIAIMKLIGSMAPDLRVQKPFMHFSLSFPHRENLEDEMMKDVMHRYLEEMGYHYCPYLAFRHFDKPHPHLHIVTTRADTDGRLVDSRHDFYRSKDACRKIEKEFGLLQNTSVKNGRKTNHKIEHSEINKYPTHFKDLQRRLDRVIAREPDTFEQYKEFCRAVGVDAQFRMNGRTPVGISYSLNTKSEKFVVRGSKLGSEYMVPQLAAELDRNAKGKRDNLRNTVSVILAEQYDHLGHLLDEFREAGISLKGQGEELRISNESVSIGINDLYPSDAYELTQKLRLPTKEQHDHHREQIKMLNRQDALYDTNRILNKWLGVGNFKALKYQLRTEGLILTINGEESVIRHEDSGMEFKPRDLKREVYEDFMRLINLQVQLAIEERERQEKEIEGKRHLYEQDLQRQQRARDQLGHDPGSQPRPEELARRRGAGPPAGWDQTPNAGDDPDEEQTRGRERGLGLGR